MKTVLTAAMLEQMKPEQLDLLYFIVFGHLQYHQPWEMVRKGLEGKEIPADKMEMVERMLTIVKNF